MKHLTHLLKTYLSSNPQNLKHFIPVVQDLKHFNYSLKGKEPTYPNFGVSRFSLRREYNWEIALIHWEQGCCSKIHAHPNGGCILLPLNGNLLEEKYENGTLTDVNMLLKNRVSYADGPEYYHKIINTDKFKVIQSLHIYLHQH